jgi:outer membrane protein insertion porin family
MKTLSNILKHLNFIFLLFFLIFFTSNLAQSENIKFLVTGQEKISVETILGIAGFKQGTDLTPLEINSGLKRLTESALFSEIEIKRQGTNIKLVVKENLKISKIYFEGNKTFEDDILNQLISSRPRNSFDKMKVRTDIQKLVSFYKQKGRFNSVITSSYIITSTGEINLIFEIFEGKLLEVDNISFIGNAAFDDKFLNSVVPSKQKNIFSFITDSDNYSEQMQTKDKAALKKFYQESGYIDVTISSSISRLSNDRNNISLVYSVNEGSRYTLGQINLISNSADILIDEYITKLKLKSGDVYNRSKVMETIKNIETLGVSKGFPFLRVQPKLTKRELSTVLTLDLILNFNQRLYVERINIKGNNQTFDKVIRREFSLVEGDAFNPLTLRKTEEKLRATGYFEKVSVMAIEGSSKEKAVINVNVVEAPTGSLNFGVGYSTDTNLTGSLSLSETNLLGKGQKLNLQLSTSKNSNSLSFSFVEPAFLDRNVSAGIRLNFRESDPDESTYTSNSLSISPSLVFVIGPDSKMTLSYEIENLDISSKNSPSKVLQNDDGQYFNSSLNSVLVYDKRNSIIEPTSGYIIKLNNSLMGLGGDIGYLKNSLRTKLYKGVKDNKVVISAEIEGGILDTLKGYSRVTDRFKLGGRNFRGFQFGEIGPRDISGDSLGGDKYLMGRLETNFPLGLPEELGLYAGLFAEMGSLWGIKAKPNVLESIRYSEKYVRSSIGVSLYWSTPIGPLQFNWSDPIDYISDVDKVERFSLNLATRF